MEFAGQFLHGSWPVPFQKDGASVPIAPDAKRFRASTIADWELSANGPDQTTG